MIVRRQEDSFVLVRQHDHGLISGEFARKLSLEIIPEKPTLFAVRNHDIGWQDLDKEIRFNPSTGAPYSFIDYPLEPKLLAYKQGLDQIEAQEPYAAYLCSMHYSSFVRNSSESAAVEFRESEESRRTKLERELPQGWLANAEYNFRVLQLCDNLSLFVCLNEPGENTYPPFKNGFVFMGGKFQPVWRDDQALSLVPNLFSGFFELSVPYRRVGRDGGVVENGEIYLKVVSG